MNLIGSHLGKELYIVTLSTLTSPIDWLKTKPYFKLVVFLDTEQAHGTESLLHFAKLALDAGARSIFCAGTAGELLHDLFDEVICANEALYTPNEDDVIPTTWHPDESVAEVLFQAFTFSSSDRFEACNPPIVITVLDGDMRIAQLEAVAKNLSGIFQS